MSKGRNSTVIAVRLSDKEYQQILSILRHVHHDTLTKSEWLKRAVRNQLTRDSRS